MSETQEKLDFQDAVKAIREVARAIRSNGLSAAERNGLAGSLTIACTKLERLIPLALVILFLVGCSGGEFSAGIHNRLDSGDTILDSRSSSNASDVTHDSLQPRDSGVAPASADSGARHVGRESGSGGRGDSDDSGTDSSRPFVPLSDAGYDVTGCGLQLAHCPCCHGYTCQLGTCI